MSYQGDKRQETLEIFEYLNDLIRFSHWKISFASAVVKVIISTVFLVIIHQKAIVRHMFYSPYIISFTKTLECPL